jgi:hypothetical protein
MLTARWGSRSRARIVAIAVVKVAGGSGAGRDDTRRQPGSARMWTGEPHALLCNDAKGWVGCSSSSLPCASAGYPPA